MCLPYRPPEETCSCATCYCDGDGCRCGFLEEKCATCRTHEEELKLLTVEPQ